LAGKDVHHPGAKRIIQIENHHILIPPLQGDLAEGLAGKGIRWVHNPENIIIGNGPGHATRSRRKNNHPILIGKLFGPTSRAQ
jgi:hypothetical protein